MVCVEEFGRRHVSARLEIEVHEPIEMVLQVAVGDMPGASRRESLTVTVTGSSWHPRRWLFPARDVRTC